MFRWLCNSSICGPCLGAIVGLFFVHLMGTSAHAVDLNSALADAYLSNPDLEAARAELRGIDEGVADAISGWRPSLSLETNVGRSSTDTTSVVTATTGATVRSKSNSALSPRSYSLSITEPIYSGGETTAKTRAARNLVYAGRAGLKVKEQEVLLNSVRSYMEVLRAQSVVELNVHNEKVVIRQLQAARDRFEVGEVTQTDVAQGEARAAQAKAELIGAEGELVSSRASYREDIGILPETLVWPIPLTTIPKGEEDALLAAKQKNPEIIRANFTERAAADQINVAYSSILPKVLLRGTFDHNYDVSASIEETESLSLTARLTIPLYQSGSEYSAIRKSKQVAGQRRIEAEKVRRAVFEEVTRAWEALMTSQAQIAAFEAQVKAAQLALDGVEREAMVGLRTTLEVLDAEQELFAARVNLIGAEHDEVVSSYWVKATVGELTVGGLDLVVERYDAVKHYNNVRMKWFGISD